MIKGLGILLISLIFAYALFAIIPFASTVEKEQMVEKGLSYVSGWSVWCVFSWSFWWSVATFLFWTRWYAGVALLVVAAFSKWLRWGIKGIAIAMLSIAILWTLPQMAWAKGAAYYRWVGLSIGWYLILLASFRGVVGDLFKLAIEGLLRKVGVHATVHTPHGVVVLLMVGVLPGLAVWLFGLLSGLTFWKGLLALGLWVTTWVLMVAGCYGISIFARTPVCPDDLGKQLLLSGLRALGIEVHPTGP